MGLMKIRLDHPAVIRYINHTLPIEQTVALGREDIDTALNDEKAFKAKVVAEWRKDPEFFNARYMETFLQFDSNEDYTFFMLAWSA